MHENKHPEKIVEASEIDDKYAEKIAQTAEMSLRFILNIQRKEEVSNITVISKAIIKEL